MPSLIASAFVAGFFILSGAEAASAPTGPVEPPLPVFSVTLTSYNAVPGQTDEDPMTTASGLYSNPEVIAARSRDLAKDLPFGTVVAIERTASDTNNCRFGQVEHLIGYRVIGDSMNARMQNRVDVLLDQNDTVTVGGKSLNPSRVLGVCNEVTVRVVGYMKLKDVPKTQEALVEMLGGTSRVAVR
ncbi:MAG: hypothetical protein WAV21_01100 [Minisyncoccia bacterium]